MTKIGRYAIDAHNTSDNTEITFIHNIRVTSRQDDEWNGRETQYDLLMEGHVLEEEHRYRAIVVMYTADGRMRLLNFHTES